MKTQQRKRNSVNPPLMVIAVIPFILGITILGLIMTDAAPQTGNGNKTQTQMVQNAFVATDGTLQVVAMGRSIPTPQAGNSSKSLTQMMQQAFVASSGTFQVVLDESSSGIPFINTSSLADHDLLHYDATGGEWVNFPATGLVSVNPTELTNNDLLRYNSAGSEWVNFHSDELPFVNLTSLADHDLLRYDLAGSKWINFPSSELPFSNFSGVANDDILQYSTTRGAWTNAQIPIPDTLYYIWKDADTVTIQAGGAAKSDDGTVTYYVAANTDLALSTGLDTGSEASSTYYWVWVGISGGVQTFKFSASATTPTGLTSPHRLGGAIPWFMYNDGSSNITRFAPPLCRTFCTAGEVHEWGSSYIPLGTITNNGAAVSRTDAKYARLFAMVGTTWGVGDNSTTYNVPDDRGRVAIGVGQGSGLTDRVLAATGGEENHALSSAENGTHTHALQTLNDLTVGGATGYRIVGGAAGLNTSSSGSGTAHNTMQPFIAYTKVTQL